MTSLEITDADKKVAVDLADDVFPSESEESENNLACDAFLDGCLYGKTQGALEVIKMLESDKANFWTSDHGIKFQVGRRPASYWASWLREKLSVK